MANGIPKEGDLHSIVTIDSYTFELRYGYYEERDKAGGVPCLLLPDLEAEPIYTGEGYQIVSAIQSVCEHYLIPEGRSKEDCCYTCDFYTDRKAEISICRCSERKRE